MVEGKPRWICVSVIFWLPGSITVVKPLSLKVVVPLSYRLQKINKSCQSWTYPVTTGKLWLQAKNPYQFPFASKSMTREQSESSAGSLTSLRMDGLAQAGWFLQCPARRSRAACGLSAPSLTWHFSKWSVSSFIDVSLSAHKNWVIQL